MEPGDGYDEDADSKRRKRLELNRKAAQESRKRKKMRIEELQRSVMFLQHENNDLRQENDMLRQMLSSSEGASDSSRRLGGFQSDNAALKAAIHQQIQRMGYAGGSVERAMHGMNMSGLDGRDAADLLLQRQAGDLAMLASQGAQGLVHLATSGLGAGAGAGAAGGQRMDSSLSGALSSGDYLPPPPSNGLNPPIGNIGPPLPGDSGGGSSGGSSPAMHAVSSGENM